MSQKIIEQIFVEVYRYGHHSQWGHKWVTKLIIFLISIQSIRYHKSFLTKLFIVNCLSLPSPHPVLLTLPCCLPPHFLCHFHVLCVLLLILRLPYYLFYPLWGSFIIFVMPDPYSFSLSPPLCLSVSFPSPLLFYTHAHTRLHHAHTCHITCLCTHTLQSRIHIWGRTCCFSFWVTSVNIIHSKSIHFSCRFSDFPFLHSWVVLCCAYVPKDAKLEVRILSKLLRI